MSESSFYRVRVQLVREGRGRRAPLLSCARDVADALRAELVPLDRERFVCCHLDVKNRLVSREVVSIGHLTSALVHPREVFKGALLANACAVVLAHNHPSGDPAPSREDLELTRRLQRAGDLLGIPVLDHVVLAETGHHSIVEGRGTRRCR